MSRLGPDGIDRSQPDGIALIRLDPLSSALPTSRCLRTRRTLERLEFSPMSASSPAPRWEHFPHIADIGVRGIGATRAQAFEQAALAMTAGITDPAGGAARGAGPIRGGGAGGGAAP